MAQSSSPAVSPANHELVITRVFDAPRSLLFKAWTDAAHLKQWWGPHRFTNPVCEVDPRPGGAILIHMRGPDGTVHPMTGVYEEVVEPERLAFLSTVPDQAGNLLFEVLTTVTFTEQGGKTSLTVQARVVKSTAEAAPYLQGMEPGWTQSLERLEVYVSTTRDGENLMTTKVAAAEAADREIVISRVFDAPRDLVWEAWTNPKHVVNWWGPKGFTTTIQVMDVRPGGTWQHTMHGPDGTDYPNKSIFKEVVKPERIVYSHGGGRKGAPGVHFEATWTFDAEAPNKTKLTMRMVFASAGDRDTVVNEYGAIEGGKQTLARLEEYLAKIA